MVSKSSMLEAQMANVVQSIANGPNYTNKSPRQFHVEKNRLNTEVSLSVRGKKGIARQRASLFVTNKEVDNGVAKGENTLAKSFLENLSVNGNAAFNFKAKSYENRPSVSSNGHHCSSDHVERQPSFQAVTKDQKISGMVEEGDDGSS